MSDDLIQLDGAQGEGGGQILRTSLTLSLLTGKPFHLTNVRAGRSKPGLQPQHLMSVRAAAQIGQARVEGDRQHSKELRFEPGPVIAGNYHFAIGTAGATSLVLQTVYLPLALKGDQPSQIVITGGTHVKASPSFHFLETTWKAYLERLGLPLRLTMRQPGFYPRGGGLIEAAIEPAATVQPLHLDAANEPALALTGFAAVAGLPVSIGERMIHRAASRLIRERLRCDLVVETWPGGPGVVLLLVLHGPPVPTLFCGLGERGKPAERVADQAVDELLAHVHSNPEAVDPHSADQILLPLALAAGPSQYATSSVTQHLITNIEVVRRFVTRAIELEGREGKPGVVRIGPG